MNPETIFLILAIICAVFLIAFGFILAIAASKDAEIREIRDDGEEWSSKDV